LKPYKVFLTADAAMDLEEIYHYIQSIDSPARAEYVLKSIEKVLNRLTEAPCRGAWPRELRDLGIHDYREIFFKPYRLIYRVIADTVYIMLIADGRRDMQSLLEQRLLEG
jgi:toxin ParE1/3/4